VVWPNDVEQAAVTSATEELPSEQATVTSATKDLPSEQATVTSATEDFPSEQATVTSATKDLPSEQATVTSATEDLPSNSPWQQNRKLTTLFWTFALSKKLSMMGRAYIQTAVLFSSSAFSLIMYTC